MYIDNKKEYLKWILANSKMANYIDEGNYYDLLKYINKRTGDDYIALRPIFNEISRALNWDGFIIEDDKLIGYYGVEEDVKIPNGVKYIDELAFLGCNSIKSVEIPDGVYEIGAFAFKRCVNLEKVSVPNSINQISTWAFHECPKLKNITLPKWFKNITFTIGIDESRVNITWI